jgi:hypothetical protein
MEECIPAVSGLFMPYLVYKYILRVDPPQVTHRILLPIFFYIIIFAIIGFTSYLIDMKRQCPQVRFDRVGIKTIIYVFLVIGCFGLVNYLEWPMMYWLNLWPKKYELFIVGLFLMICSQLSYYVVKISTSPC